MIFFLVGMPCAGKTHFGAAFAAAQNCDFVDLDAEIERLQSRTITDIFTKNGELAFREIERSTLQNLDLSLPKVIATGGGAPCFSDNMSLMRTRGTVLWLDPKRYILLQRLSANTAHRPLFHNLNPLDLAEKVSELYEKRKFFYAQAHFRCT